MQETIEIFGKEVKLKQYYCSFFGKDNLKVENPYFNLYVRTKYCNAKCQFCTYHSDANKWHQERYLEVLNELTSKLEVRKIALSGGEPTLYWDNFKNIIQTSRGILPEVEISLTTDGLNWEKLFSDPIYKEIYYIQLSRHHYNDKLNSEIFRTKTPPSELIKEMSQHQIHEHQIQFRCNLIKGYIDNKEEVFKYLDWMNSVNINDVGLVSLMPINDYSKENFVGFNIKDLVGENFVITKSHERFGGGCVCFNYVYLPEEFRRPIRVYYKNTFRPQDTTETLSFDGYNLRVGFDGDIIY